MAIIRHDSDVLVFQNSDRRGRLAVIFFVVLTGPLSCAGYIWQTKASGTGPFDPWVGLAMLGAIASSFVFGFVFPYSECYAFARSTRQFLLARRFLFRKTSVELDFNRVRDVTVDRVQADGGDAWFVFMTMSDGKKIAIDSSRDEDAQRNCSENAVILREFLRTGAFGFDSSVPELAGSAARAS